MSNLKQIRERIKNVNTTEQLIVSMKNIAISKLVKAKKLYENSRDYFKINCDTNHYLMYALSKNYEAENFIENMLFEGYNNLPKLIIVIGADKGFCGSYHSLLMKDTHKLIKDLQAKGKDFKLFVLGKKAADHLNLKYGSKVITSSYKFDISYFKLQQTLATVNFIFYELLLSQQFGSVCMVHSNFFSVLNNKPQISNILPVDFSNIISSNKTQEIESNLNLVTDRLIDRIEHKVVEDYLFFWLYKYIVEGFASEYSSRLTAMDNSLKNAEEMSDSLTLLYNETRQAQITREIIEITSGNC